LTGLHASSRNASNLNWIAWVGFIAAERLKCLCLRLRLSVALLKTTVTLREDLYEILRRKYGPKGLSEAINTILAGVLLKGEGMFGTMEKASLRDLRDHRDRV